MSTAHCPLCDSLDNEKRFVESGRAVLRCDNCGLFFIDPYPNVSDVRQSIGETKEGPSTALSDRYAAEEVFYAEHFDAIQAHCVGARNLLEVGCGTGRLLELMRDSGLDCEGVELDPKRAQAARSRSGCTVHTAPAEELQTEKTYDVITMINVLSHVPSISDLFIAIDRLLSDRGRLIIMAGEMREDVERGDILRWDIPIHMHFLGFSTIDYICAKFGFRVLARKRTPYSSSLFSRARFLAPGRSRMRNLIKGLILRIPLALRLLRWNYDRKRAGRVMTSLIVLAKATS